MNTLPGTIKDLQTHGNLTLVKVAVEDQLFTSIVIETPTTVNYLKTGASIQVMFKETEVIISREPVEISLQNRIPATLVEIKSGELLSQLKLQFNQHVFRSIITSKAVEQLKIQTGQQVYAMVKTNEIMLAE